MDPESVDGTGLGPGITSRFASVYGVFIES